MPEAVGLSVVIPTRDRCDTLALTLAALECQHGVDDGFEVIVVDDGSADHTAEWLAGRSPASFELKVSRTSGLGPAAARNLGIRSAVGERVLLLGDDTAPAPKALATHLSMGGNNQVAVQGLIEWDPAEPITELMLFLAPEGPQFWFRGLSEGDSVEFTSVYGSNLSAPTRWFREEPFDEGFPSACFEDTEMAWRWTRRDWPVVFSASARCHHRHHYDSINPILVRQKLAGAATRRLVRRHPRLVWRMLLQPAAAGLRVALRSMIGNPTGGQRAAWDRQCRLAWLKGLVGLA